MVIAAFTTLFAKTGQQIGFAYVQKNVSLNMRTVLYEKVLRKEIGWHDKRDNSSGVIGTMLNSEVNSLSAVTIDVAAAYLEGGAGIFIGFAIGFFFSWPIVLCVMGIAPIMMMGSKVGNKVKLKQYNMIKGEQKENNEADILMSDSIANYKTVASIANYGILLQEF